MALIWLKLWQLWLLQVGIDLPLNTCLLFQLLPLMLPEAIPSFVLLRILGDSDLGRSS